jgi:hypothetical protein
MAEYNVAVHEAGHAVVAAALGIAFANRGVTLSPPTDLLAEGVIATVSPRSPFTLRPLDNIALCLAGGIAECRVTRAQPGIRIDVVPIMFALSKRFDDTKDPTAQSSYRWLKAMFRHCDGDGERDETQVLSITSAFCMKQSTAEVLAAFAPEVSVGLAQESHFILMAEAADIARDILNRHWSAVLALGSHLMNVKELNETNLTDFLTHHGVTNESMNTFNALSDDKQQMLIEELTTISANYADGQYEGDGADDLIAASADISALLKSFPEAAVRGAMLSGRANDTVDTDRRSGEETTFFTLVLEGELTKEEA